MGFDNLPFPRGTVLECGSATEYENLVGNVYTVMDTEHNSGGEVKLRVVRNHSGSSITLDNRAVRFGTATTDLGRYVVGFMSAATQPAKIIDDAYTAGTDTAAANYLFYVVEEGPVNIRLETNNADVDATAHAVVVPTATGCARDGTVASTTAVYPVLGRYTVAVANAAVTTTERETTVIHAFGGLGTVLVAITGS